MIRYGDKGEAVRQLQARLQVPVDGSFGPVTLKALMKFQKAQNLVPDGLAGPITLKALGLPVSFEFKVPSLKPINPLMKEAVLIGMADIGVREIPKSSNRGPDVEKYLAAVGLGGGYPYCCAYVVWCTDQASKKLGMPNPLKRTGLCQALYNATDPEDRFRFPQRTPMMGDLFFIYKPSLKRLAHIGFVLSYLGDGAIETVEANTNVAGSRDGDGVYQNTRKASELRFVRIP